MITLIFIINLWNHFNKIIIILNNNYIPSQIKIIKTIFNPKYQWELQFHLYNLSILQGISISNPGYPNPYYYPAPGNLYTYYGPQQGNTVYVLPLGYKPDRGYSYWGDLAEELRDLF